MTWTTDNPAIVETWGLRGSFQARAIDALAVAPRGILIAPAGSGKTIMLARSIETILRSLPDGQALRLLWLANTRDQLDQAKKALELLAPLRSRFSGWVRTPAGCGPLDLSLVDIIVIDECHHGSSASWAAVIRGCVNARVVWGMTATGHREDGEWPAVEEIIGPVVCEITKAEVAGDGFAVPARVEWIVPGALDQHKEAVRSLAEDGSPSRLDTMLRKCRWSMIKQGKDYAQVAEDVRARVTYQAAVELVISKNRLRNDLAAHHCYQAVLWGESVLCLVCSVEQGEYIAAAVGGALVHSKLGKKLRRERIAAFRDGTVKCLVSTSLADEGLDVPIASTLVMACGGRGMSKALGTDGKKRTTAKIEQRTARVLRPVPGKDDARIVDFFDWQHPMMLGASWTRRKGYAELGFRQRVPAEIVGQRRPAPAGREGDLFQ